MKATDWFYKTESWKACREAYAKSVGGLCERCLKEGKVVPGEIVHHKKHLDPDNVNDATVSLAWDNLELLCRECHGMEHRKIKKRYKVDALGRVTPRSEF